mgnify:CR=1 FL=1
MEPSSSKPSLLERLSALLTREPEDREELLHLLHAAHDRNLFDADALAIIEGALQVSEMQVRDVMIPRAQMDVVNLADSVEDITRFAIGAAHSRFPVVGEGKDDVLGVLLAKDLLRVFAGESFNLREMLRPAVFVPESKRLNVLLRDFRVSRNHMAIVVDEYGGVAGLVTIEDVLEQIVGDIEDEYDFDETADNIRIDQAGRYRVKAGTEIEDFNEAFGCEFSDSEYDTVGGLLIRKLGRLPKRNEVVELEVHVGVLHAHVDGAGPLGARPHVAVAHALLVVPLLHHAEVRRAAAQQADVVMIVIPDEQHKKLYDEFLKDNLKKGAALFFAHARSALCLPLVVQGQAQGVLYLENNLAAGAFTPARRETLAMLSTQIAISLAHAKLYARLDEARNAAEAASRAKSTFLANMSHELRTPLNAILGYADLIEEETPPDTQLADDIRKIQRASRHLLDIISDILDLSKIEADKLDVLLQPFPLGPLLAGVLETIGPAVARSGNTLVFRPPPELGTMYSDPVRLRQVLLNLLSNAAKFTHLGTITLIAERAGERIRFTVEDTGIGMSPAQAEKVFDAFHQVDASTTRQVGGTGLGLTISRRLCQLLGGDISLHSVPGQGSSFTIDLPARAGPQPRPAIA